MRRTDTPYLLAGYGVLVFKSTFFKISSIKLHNALLLLTFTNYFIITAFIKYDRLSNNSLQIDWDILFQLLFDELLNPPPSVDPPAPKVIALITKVVAPEPAISTGSPSSTTVDHDAPSPIAHMGNDPKWTKDHLLENIIGELGRPVSTRLQLHEQALFCYYDAFLGTIEPKKYKDALTQSCSIEAMQEELNEFKCLRVYVSQPDGFEDKDNPNHVYKLKKVLYGLKQALHAWYDMLSSFLISEDFSKGSVDPTFPRGIFINLSKYALESLKKYGFNSCNPLDTPMVEKSKLDEDKEGKAVDPSHYHGMIGTLLYLTARTVNQGLWYLKDSSIALIAFADADHAGCQDTHRSTSGSMQFSGDRLLTDYGFGFNKILMYCDNKSTITLCCNNVPHSRSKHIDIRFHFIKDHVENGVIELYFVNMEYQLADIFTKALGRDRIEFLINKLGMRSFTSETLKLLAD
ncbi:retrovirus-related pol polyprotein from transposon TNT 1-94 [Tanacetum coccineum]|uniref:Retrovirus-related pol polyprotein from transposon TNT 1-94 n=1 Tax=Tanacetum coccineum TaxID=301880 RepID=A0ABQ5HB71_9ASTR